MNGPKRCAKPPYVRATKDGWSAEELKKLGLEPAAVGRRHKTAVRSASADGENATTVPHGDTLDGHVTENWTLRPPSATPPGTTQETAAAATALTRAVFSRSRSSACHLIPSPASLLSWSMNAGWLRVLPSRKGGSAVSSLQWCASRLVNVSLCWPGPRLA